MKDENYVMNVLRELYWAGYTHGTTIRWMRGANPTKKCREELALKQLNWRKTSIDDAYKRMAKRFGLANGKAKR